jgi:hypothetical protein
VNYAKRNGNRAAERRFGSPPTEKIREWRSEKNHEDDFSGGDDELLGFCDE